MVSPTFSRCLMSWAQWQEWWLFGSDGCALPSNQRSVQCWDVAVLSTSQLLPWISGAHSCSIFYPATKFQVFNLHHRQGVVTSLHHCAAHVWSSSLNFTTESTTRQTNKKTPHLRCFRSSLGCLYYRIGEVVTFSSDLLSDQHNAREKNSL